MHPGSCAPPGPTTSDAPAVRPSARWYALAGGIAVVGILGGTIVSRSTVGGTRSAVEDFARSPLPAVLPAELAADREYVVYYEHPAASSNIDSGVVPASGDLQFGVQVTVTDPAGTLVRLRPYGRASTYDTAGHEGKAVYAFDTATSGTYQITAGQAEEPSGEDTIAIGPALNGDPAAVVARSVLVGAVSALVALLLAVLVGVRRGASRRTLAAAAASGTGAGGWTHRGRPTTGWEAGRPTAPEPSWDRPRSSAGWGAPQPAVPPPNRALGAGAPASGWEVPQPTAPAPGWPVPQPTIPPPAWAQAPGPSAPGWEIPPPTAPPPAFGGDPSAPGWDLPDATAGTPRPPPGDGLAASGWEHTRPTPPAGSPAPGGAAAPGWEHTRPTAPAGSPAPGGVAPAPPRPAAPLDAVLPPRWNPQPQPGWDPAWPPGWRPTPPVAAPLPDEEPPPSHWIPMPPPTPPDGPPPG